ncbi:unnamed protein product [Thlaspi arvense]|uniref:BHLH domain-containing protein n=1 Tax=Thlaspi arvense TaxID=13288 RepID=A0AAU9T6V3_THLAR|nr:unnamed protein product [Thlaspi arvense]
MTEEFETAGVCTGTWWSSSNCMFSWGSLPCSTEIAIDIGDFEWKNIDTLDAKTYNESHHNTCTFLSNTNPDSNSQVYVSTQSNIHEEESLNLELLDSFHFLDDFLLNESRNVSVFDHEISHKAEEEILARANEKTGELKDIDSSRQLKRQRLETPSQFPSFKVRKEKLGDRITALQQLVSPFGKTDTASVLHDAIEYIKFLQEQITVSSNPHLYSIIKDLCSDESNNNTNDEDYNPRQDLRSRGLCLMPISSTFSTSPPHLKTYSFWN